LRKAIRFLLGLLVVSQLAQAQSDSTGKVLADFRSGSYLDKVGSQATGLSKQITERSNAYLRGIAAEESKLQAKLTLLLFAPITI